MHIAEDARPALWRLARLGFDHVRGRPVLLYPEGAMFLNDSGAAILELCDGSRTFAQIVTELGAKFEADVKNDVEEYVNAMVERELVTLSAR